MCQEYKHLITNNFMPKAGFEPARLAAPPPQDGVSASSTTSARSRGLTVTGTGARNYIISFPACSVLPEQVAAAVGPAAVPLELPADPESVEPVAVVAARFAVLHLRG